MEMFVSFTKKESKQIAPSIPENVMLSIKGKIRLKLKLRILVQFFRNFSQTCAFIG